MKRLLFPSFSYWGQVEGRARARQARGVCARVPRELRPAAGTGAASRVRRPAASSPSADSRADMIYRLVFF